MESPTQKPGAPRPSWIAIIGMMVAPTMMICAWMISLSNRVAVLEAESSRPSTTAVETAVEIAALKQELLDFRREYEQDSTDAKVVAARNGKN
jgi:hypothetical protein